MGERPEAARIALAEAAASAHEAMTGRPATDADDLSALAAFIAKEVPVLYAREGWGRTIGPVPPDVLDEAVVLEGGSLMRSRNVPYTDLSVNRRDLPEVIERLRRLKGGASS